MVLPELSDQALFLRQIQEVDEEVHARPGFLRRQPVDSAEEGQGVADGELAVQRQILHNTGEGCVNVCVCVCVCGVYSLDTSS